MSKLPDATSASDADPTPPPFVRLASEHGKQIFALLAGATGAALLVGADISVPRSVQIIAAAAVLSTPIGFYAGKRVASLLYEPNWVYIVDLDTRTQENSLYRIPSNAYSSLEVTEGEVDRPNPHLVFAQDVDLEAETMRGVWRGTLSDRELMAELSKVYEIRGQLQEDAQRGFAIESQAWMIVRDATTEATKSIIRTFERGTMPTQDGLEVSDAVNDAIESFDFALVEDSSEPENDPFDSAADADAPDGPDLPSPKMTEVDLNAE